MKKILLALLLIVPSAHAAEPGSFLSKLYFPFSFGFAVSTNDKVLSGIQFKSGLEYRFKPTNGFFTRFNYDNRSNKYITTPNATTNVTKGRLKLDDFGLGAGYRIGQEKMKMYGIVQPGFTLYEYDFITGSTDQYATNSRYSAGFLTKFIVGTEYYVGESAAILLEMDYALINKNADFWDGSLGTLGITLGFSTVLF